MLAGLDVEVIQARFEEWGPPAGELYDLVFAATAWHWLDPDVRYRKSWRHLRPGGHLAFWSATHVFPPGGDSFADIQPVYDEIGEALPPDATRPAPGELPDSRAEIESTPPRHLLRPHRDGAGPARAPVQRDPSPPGRARGRTAPPALGRGPPRRAPARLARIANSATVIAAALAPHPIASNSSG